VCIFCTYIPFFHVNQLGPVSFFINQYVILHCLSISAKSQTTSLLHFHSFLYSPLLQLPSPPISIPTCLPYPFMHPFSSFLCQYPYPEFQLGVWGTADRCQIAQSDGHHVLCRDRPTIISCWCHILGRSPVLCTLQMRRTGTAIQT